MTKEWNALLKGAVYQTGPQRTLFETNEHENACHYNVLLRGQSQPKRCGVGLKTQATATTLSRRISCMLCHARPNSPSLYHDSTQASVGRLRIDNASRICSEATPYPRKPKHHPEPDPVHPATHNACHEVAESSRHLCGGVALTCGHARLPLLLRMI